MIGILAGTQKLTPLYELLTHGDGQSSPAAISKLAILLHTPPTPAQDKIRLSLLIFCHNYYNSPMHSLLEYNNNRAYLESRYDY